MTLLMRLAAYAPNGARRSVLPTPQALTSSVPLNDVGALTLTYPANGPRVADLAGPTELALEVSRDDGQTWVEPPSCRFLTIERDSDPLDQVPVLKVSAPALAWRFSKARVLPEGKTNAEGKRAFLSSTGGNIIKTLTTEAQARGALAGLDFSTFSSTTDSAGQPWSKIITLYYEPGADYLTVLLNLASQGVIDWRMEGRSLRVYNAEQYLNTDADGVTLQCGADLTEAPYKASLAGLASFLYLAGDQGVSSQRTNPEAATPWGRWETFISQGGVSDQATMNALSDVALQDGARERVENTYGLSLAAARKYPLLDYFPGQFLLVRRGEGQPERLRCRQVTLSQDADRNVGGNVVLNDRFLEDEVKRTRRITGITGGASADGGSGARPVPPASDGEGDNLPPGRPDAPEVTSSAYTNSSGQVRARLLFNWTLPLYNTDGSVYDDHASTEVFYSVDADNADLNHAGTFPGDLRRGGVENMEAGVWRRWYIRVVDKSGNASALSPYVTHLSAVDTTAPAQPSTPTVTPWTGQLVVAWDGKNAQGGGMPTDWDRTEVHVSDTSGFTPTAATRFDSIETMGGRSVITGTPYGAQRYVRLVAFDVSGNASVASAQASATPKRVTEEAMEDSSVTYLKIAPFAVTNAAIQDAAIDVAKIGNLTVGAVKAGTIVADWTLSARIKTADTGARMEMSGVGLSGYNTSGTRTFYLNSSNGNVTASGTFTAQTEARAVTITPSARVGVNTGVILPGITLTPETITGNAIGAALVVWPLREFDSEDPERWLTLSPWERANQSSGKHELGLAQSSTYLGQRNNLSADYGNRTSWLRLETGDTQTHGSYLWANNAQLRVRPGDTFLGDGANSYLQLGPTITLAVPSGGQLSFNSSSAYLGNGSGGYMQVNQRFYVATGEGAYLEHRTGYSIIHNGANRYLWITTTQALLQYANDSYVSASANDSRLTYQNADLVCRAGSVTMGVNSVARVQATNNGAKVAGILDVTDGINATVNIGAGQNISAGFYMYARDYFTTPSHTEFKTDVVPVNLDAYAALDAAAPHVWNWRSLEVDPDTMERTVTGPPDGEASIGLLVDDLAPWITTNSPAGKGFSQGALTATLWEACRLLLADVRDLTARLETLETP